MMQAIHICVSCDQPFAVNIDDEICDACFHEAMQHQPTLYARIKLEGGGSFVQPLDKVGEAFANEFSGDAEAGMKWTVELIEMTPAEFAALPEFTGH